MQSKTITDHETSTQIVRDRHGKPGDAHQTRASEGLKRAMDLAIAIPTAIFLLPALLLIALIVYLDDGGPVIFSHRRRGQNGRDFTCLKFRTMVRDAENRLQHLLANDPAMRAEWDATQKLRKDPRLTRTGGFLRRFSIDELPQLWNIIKGEMSIVGPRPIVDNEVRRYGDDIRFYDAVRPGVVGLWQVSGRNDTTYDERVALDVEYALSRSLAYDVAILFRAVPAVLLSRGAY